VIGRGPKPAKSKEAKPLSRKSSKNDSARVSDLEKRLAETHEQQAATAEILRVIASSPTHIQPVFDAVANSAARLCDSLDAYIFRRDGDRLLLMAHYGSILVGGPVGDFSLPLVRGIAASRSVMDGRTIHVADLQNEAKEFPEGSGFARRLGFRTILVVPLMRKGVAIGTISIRRAEVRPFNDSQIALLKTFADQAVIAIENVRLFKELEARNRDLTATSEILQVISRSPTDVQPVFDTIAERAMRLCDAAFGFINTFDGARIHMSAFANINPRGLNALQQVFPQTPSRGTGAGRVVLSGNVVHIPDVLADPEYQLTGPAQEAELRSLLGVPLLHQRRVTGVILVSRPQAGTFSDEQVELLRTFADQAVIAIENVRLFKELEAANREIAAASQHKSEFLAHMSHELRTPLNAIIGFSEVLSDRLFGELNEKQEEYLKDINASGTHLLSLINDILDLSKIEAGRMELELSECDLPTAIENALMLVRERAGRRSIALHTNIDAQLGLIEADERKVRQVVLNLLSNAIKFTPEGGRIDVGAVPKDGFVEVSVSDTGIGIAPEDQEKVFEEFRQVGTAAKKVEGTGLGLTLCRKFVELHGGRIWVKSQEGVGSMFAFTLPMHRGE